VLLTATIGETGRVSESSGFEDATRNIEWTGKFVDSSAIIESSVLTSGGFGQSAEFGTTLGFSGSLLHFISKLPTTSNSVVDSAIAISERLVDTDMHDESVDFESIVLPDSSQHATNGHDETNIYQWSGSARATVWLRESSLLQSNVVVDSGAAAATEIVAKSQLSISNQFGDSSSVNPTIHLLPSLQDKLTNAGHPSQVLKPTFVARSDNFAATVAIAGSARPVSILFGDSNPSVESQSFLQSINLTTSGGFNGTPINGFPPSIVLLGSTLLRASLAHGFADEFLTIEFVDSSITASVEFPFSGDFTASIFGVDGNQDILAMGGQFSMSSVWAVTVAPILLIVVSVLILMIVKRYKRNQDIDPMVEYETEAQAIDIEDSESEEDAEDEWDIEEIDNAIDSVFDRTRELKTDNDGDGDEELFTSGCDEIF
jgi:hypothetical protein